MKKMQNKGNNKGFSLVELIVVIAIMAVLVAVLAPQFTKYVDRSRMSNDSTTVAGIVTAVQTGVADLTDYEIADATYIVKVNKTSGTNVYLSTAPTVALTVAGSGKGNIVDAIKNSCGELTALKETSKKFDPEIEFSITIAGGVPTVDYSASTDFAAYIGK